MATTNEGAVKERVKKVLKNHAPQAWFFMPVSAGFGVMGIPDFVGVHNGRFFGIETKAPGRRGQTNGGLSGLQVRCKALILAAGGAYFVVDDEETLEEVELWLLNGSGMIKKG